MPPLAACVTLIICVSFSGVPFGGRQLAGKGTDRVGGGLFLLQSGDGSGSASLRDRLQLIPPHLQHLSTPEGLALAMGLLAPLMDAYRHMCMYRCKEALQAFSRCDRRTQPFR